MELTASKQATETLTNDEKLRILLNKLKQYAESRHCYDIDDSFEYDSPDWSKDQVFDSAATWAEITLARTLLESLREEFEYPCRTDEK